MNSLPILLTMVMTFEAQAQEGETIRLPFTALEVLPAKNGELLVVKFSGSKQVGIIDLKQKKLTKIIKVSTEDYRFAAGGNRLLVHDPTADVLEVYDLEKFERVKAKKSPIPGVICAMAMGSNNPRTALLRVSEGTGALDRVHYELLDLEKFSTVQSSTPPHNSSYRDAEQIRMNPSGTMFGAWATSHSPTGQIVGRIAGSRIEMSYEHDSVGHVIPLPGKDLAVTGSGAVISFQGRRVKEHKGLCLYPDHTGNFYIGVSNKKVAVFVSNDHQLITSLATPMSTRNEWDRQADARPFVNSALKVLVRLSESQQELVVVPLDPIGDLKRSGLDFLVVTSSPPARVKVGESLEYEVKAETNSKSFSITLVDGPEGAEVVGNKLTWRVPESFKEEQVEFLLKVSNTANDETYHSFQIQVARKGKAF